MQDYWSLLATGQPASAFAQMARTHLAHHEWAQAYQGFLKAHRLRRGLPWNETHQLPGAGSQPLQTGLHKLQHDCQQLAYLIENGYLPPGLAPFLNVYEHLYQNLAECPPHFLLYQLPPNQSEAIQAIYDRNLFHDPPLACRPTALNTRVDWKHIQATYTAQAPGMVYVDHFLNPAALQALYDFCLTATVWHDCRKWGGYLGAYMHDGFNSPLLFQIAAELQAAMPQVFQGHSLTQMWAYKYDSQRQGIAVHADAAAINVNFWVTPDQANRDPNSGGMVIYDKVAPETWVFDDYNVDTLAIKRFIRESEAQAVRVPYRQNRAVIFNSSLFHETDVFYFGDAYSERRINITMLFGYKRLP